MFQPLTRTAAAGTPLAVLAPGVDWDLMLRSGETDHAVTIRNGAVTAVRTGPFLLPSWQTRLTAPETEWQAFLAPVPRPGHHDIIALLRRRAITFDGDLHPLMANMYYVKKLLESLRPEQVAA
ncbi:hypothetical protein GCM10011360_14560 [Primorskyibacter flagellatus]|uniref:SCP2 domain-containing protein n=1 Tax=Primorskyibacter flagellatus TaxID=1387277 RepID=A0A917A4S3_9RHOB|nr:hypothetical protein [Primorskyibacter flagellatus]GGE27354.1 hypothetical protein GCM10011360_14560 [Primorskyibacter flagellatus]